MIQSFHLSNERALALTAILDHNIKALTMIDSGALTYFVDEAFIMKINFVPHLKSCAKSVHEADGRPSASGMITHEIDLPLAINEHQEILTF